MASSMISTNNPDHDGVRIHVPARPGKDADKSSFAYKYLLILRFTLINLIGFAMVAAGWIEGWFDAMMQSEQSYLLAIIAATFLLGLVVTAQKLWQISIELNALRSGSYSADSRTGKYMRAAVKIDAQGRSNLISALKLKFGNRIGVVRTISNSLVILGLIGTVIGFIIALSGVDPDAVADVSAVAPMVSVLISGMSVALYTTLVGSVLNVWLNINYRILESGTVSFLTKLAEIGENNE
jgi:hypothetical protein